MHYYDCFKGSVLISKTKAFKLKENTTNDGRGFIALRYNRNTTLIERNSEHLIMNKNVCVCMYTCLIIIL